MPTDDAKIYALMEVVIARLESITRARGKYMPFTFLNDAYTTQPVFANYGEDNLAKLRAAARKYDPKGMFQTQVPGGSKVFGNLKAKL